MNTHDAAGNVRGGLYANSAITVEQNTGFSASLEAALVKSRRRVQDMGQPMLEHLFGSRTRVRLISLFLSAPNEPVFVRELTRRINTQINAVRRELANLMKLELVREVRGSGADAKRPGLKRRYYQLNAVHPLLPEIKALITKAQVLLEHRLDRELESMGQVKYAALMGSFLGATGAPVDLFIVGNIQQATLKKLLAKMEKALGHEVNYTLLSPQEFQYRKEIADKFLMGVLNAPKNVVVDRLSDAFKHKP